MLPLALPAGWRLGTVRVWVTRTQPGADRLAAALRNAGHEAHVAPVLAISPTGHAPPEGCFDFVLFVSEHALRCAAAGGWRNAAWAHCPSAAIGRIGEATLREFGVVPCLGGLDNAKSVTATLAEAPQRSLIVKGEGGRQLLQNWLRDHGGTVVEWDVYRRQPTAPDMAGEAVDAIVVASADGLVATAEAWFAANGSPAVQLFVPSERIARRAARLGFGNIVVTLGANAEATVAAMRGERQ